MSMRQMTLLTGMSAVLVLAAHARASLVFEDNFSGTHASFTDGQTFASDSVNTGNIAGFWKANLGNSTTIGSEGGGALTLSATTSGASDPITRPLTSVTSAVGSTFNIFTQGLTFTGTGIALGGTEPNGYAKIGRFGLISNTTNSYAASSALYFKILASNKVTFYAKTGAPNTGGTILVNDVQLTGTITGFALTLDATTYDLDIVTTTGTTNFAGSHGLTAAAWGNGGNAGMVMEAQRATNNNEGAIGKTATMTIDQLTVMIPEPATLGLMTLGGMMMTYRGRR